MGCSEKLTKINLFSQYKEDDTQQIRHFGGLVSLGYIACLLIAVIVLAALQAATTRATVISIDKPQESDYQAMAANNPICPCTNTLIPYGNLAAFSYQAGVCYAGFSAYCVGANTTGVALAASFASEGMPTPQLLPVAQLNQVLQSKFAAYEAQFTNIMRGGCAVSLGLQTLLLVNVNVNTTYTVQDFMVAAGDNPCEDAFLFQYWMIDWGFTGDTSTSFSKYFTNCAPLSCSYTVISKPSAVEVVVSVVGLIGGVNAVLAAIGARAVGFFAGRHQQAGDKGGKAVVFTGAMELESQRNAGVSPSETNAS